MTPLSRLCNEYLRHYGRREVDGMVADFLQRLAGLKDLVAGRPHSQRHRIQRFSFGILLCTVSNILIEFWYMLSVHVV